MNPAPTVGNSPDPLDVCRRFGWWSLLAWATLGLLLEALHGFKVGWYLEVVNDGRRLQLTLAHAHGVLLALVTLAFAAAVRPADAPRLARAGWCLRMAAVLMPVGFLGGGLMAMGADPGLPIALVPVGGALLFLGLLQVARASGGAAPAPGAAAPPTAPPAGPAPGRGKGGRAGG